MINGTTQLPPRWEAIETTTRESGFTMSSDLLAGSLLRVLAASKPAGMFLELGTGTGLATAWILDGMDRDARLVSIDNDGAVLAIARQHLANDSRLTLECVDGGEWVNRNKGHKYDFIFADTWHGKYLLLDEVLAMLSPGGIYVIDDMLPQANWPDGHADKATQLVRTLEKRSDLALTKLRWSTGIIIGVKRT